MSESNQPGLNWVKTPEGVIHYTRFRCVFCGWTDVLKGIRAPKCCDNWDMVPVLSK